MRKTNLSLLIVVLLLFASSCSQTSDSIFNGKDLSNWNFVLEDNNIPAEEVYYVEDGMIVVKGEPLGYMYTKQKYSDYTLELEYRWAEGESNSGIFLMIEDPANPFPKGIECQLMAGKAGDFVLLKGADLEEYVLPEGETERPQFPVIEKYNTSNEKPAGEWNRVKIEVESGVITVYINDTLQNRATSNVTEGYIGLQSEGKEIQFRNITLK